MSLNTYDLSGGSTQSSAIDMSADTELHMQVTCSAISKNVTVLLEYSLDSGTTWHPLQHYSSDNPDQVPLEKNVFKGTKVKGWIVKGITVTSVRQSVVVPADTTGTIAITDVVV